MLGLGLIIQAGQKVLGGLNALLKALIERATYSENIKDSNTIIEAIDGAGVLDDATILLTPTAWSSAILHSVKDGTSNSDFDVVSDTDATRVNSSGLIEDIDANQPRINYNPDGSNGHILLEPTATNLVDYSENFDNLTTSWSLGSSPTINSASVTNPTSGSGCWEILSTSSASRLQLNLGTLAAGKYTQSLFVKRKDADVRISFRNNTFGANNTFNITSSGVTEDSAPSLNKIEDYGNGWFRISITIEADGIKGSYLQIYGDLDSTFDSYYIWGCQLEKLSYISSYIPTVGSPITRSGETLTGSGNSTLINSTEGVLYAEIGALANDGTNRRIAVSDGTSANRIMLEYSSVSNVLRAYVITSSTTVANLSYTLSDATNFSKVALKWKVNDFALWVDGTERDTDTVGTVPSASTLTTLDFNGGVGNNYYGKCKCLAVFNVALDDTQLGNLTT